ncbi:OmpW family outer membrane protein [Candidatus Lariskella endosymbiont of Epinotia ramella]|uniref:OmpW family outer membrane protein n=1 Tax=Candidatus Lariskella endosymbiont of Epinotia ramella TaxID=3066224 RepID=UPI0030CA981D
MEGYMKNLGMISYAALAATILAGTALADGDKTNKFKPFYVKASAGYEILSRKTSVNSVSDSASINGPATKFSIGYHFAQSFATELDLGVFYRKENDSHTVKYNAFVNCQYNFTPTSQFSPYIKAGLGYHGIMSQKINLPAAAVGVGIIYNASNNIFLDIGYTFSMSIKSKVEEQTVQELTGDIKVGNLNLKDVNVKFNTSLTAHNIAIGVGFRF